MTTHAIGHAKNTLSPAEFTSHALAMGNRFRGFATIETSVVIADSKIKGGKGSGYSGRITKRSRTQVVLNPRLEGYEDAVNKQRAKECDDVSKLEHFTAAPRQWGHHIEGSSFVEHKGKYYLEVRVLKCLETLYFIDGQPVDNATAEALLHPNRESKRQGVDNPIILRDYGVDSLVGLVWTCPDGIKYTLTIDG